MWSSEAADGRREVVWARTGEERTREDREQKTRGLRGILRERVNNREKKKKRGCSGWTWFRGKEETKVSSGEKQGKADSGTARNILLILLQVLLCTTLSLPNCVCSVYSVSALSGDDHDRLHLIPSGCSRRLHINVPMSRLGNFEVQNHG